MIRKEHRSAGAGLGFVLSTEDKDRLGDIVRASGWRLDRFRANPVCLFGHDSRFLVGTWANVRIEGKSLRGDLQLAPAGLSERLDEVRGLVKANVLRATSVGFSAIESRPLKDGEGGIEFLRQELVEVSLCAVPANASCLAVAKSLGVSEATRSLVFAPTDYWQRQREEYLARLRTMTPQERQAEARAVYERGRSTLARLDEADREREWEQIRRDTEDAELLLDPPSPGSRLFRRYLDLLSGVK